MLMPAGTVHPLYSALLGVTLLCGCATTQTPIYAPLDTNYSVSVKQAFEDLPNGTYIDFQQGQRILPGNLDRWSTYCRLFVYNHARGADYSTSVLPGTFTISEVKIGYQSSDYPNNPIFGRISWGVRDVPSFYLYQVGMRLDSPDQPEVRSLICYKKWATPRANEYPTLAQIRTALGNQIVVNLPPTAN